MKMASRATLVAAVCLGLTVVWAPPAFAARSLTATPSTGLIDRQTIAVFGAVFNPNAAVGYCQAIQSASPSVNDCASGGASTTTASASGDFHGGVFVRRLIFVPSLGRTVNCAVESCVIGAAEFTGFDVIPGTVAYAPISFAPGQPDGRIKRRSDGEITGDNVYNSDGFGQTRIRAVQPGTTWTFAVQLENDSPTADNIKIAAPPSSAPITVHYFVGYYDVTVPVTGGGFTFTDQAPGQLGTFAVHFTVDPGAPLGAGADPLITYTSNTAGAIDAVRVGVVVQAVTAQSGSD
jgi:hypothetical protein